MSEHTAEGYIRCGDPLNKVFFHYNRLRQFVNLSLACIAPACSPRLASIRRSGPEGRE